MTTMLALKFCHRPFLQSSSSSRYTAGAWVKHSPPKRLRNASAVAVSGKQNRI
jgi:hypothetical protein